jgi:hypothetical protein
MPPSAKTAVVKWVVRPYSVAFAILGFWLVFHKDWLLGGLFLLAWFTISVAGADLERWDRSQHQRYAESLGSLPLHLIETHQITRVYMKNFLVLGAIGIVLLHRAGLRWYFAAPAGLLAGYAVLMVPTLLVQMLRLRSLG